MVQLDVTFVLTTGKTERAKGAHHETGEYVREREKAKRSHHAKQAPLGKLLLHWHTSRMGTWGCKPRSRSR